MYRQMLSAKIHCARVTQAELEYEGSLTIDQDLMDKVGIAPFEKILVANMKNGRRFETYAIAGKRRSGTICLNGATAHMGKIGDRLTIFTFTTVPEAKVRSHKPAIIRLDKHNRPAGTFGKI